MEKYRQLVKKMMEKKSVIISFSGGVDSILVAKACIDAKIKCVAITIISPLMAKRWIDDAKKMAKMLGIKHEFIHKKLDENILKNDELRCYYCKKKDAILLKEYAKRNSYAVIADGINASDDYIGKKAGDEEGIWHPLVEENIGKKEVRNILKWLGIKEWNKNSESCLATRIPKGVRITEGKLKKVEKGEEILLKYVNFVRLRYGKIARIETRKSEISTLLNHKKEILDELKKLGFEKIEIKEYAKN